MTTKGHTMDQELWSSREAAEYLGVTRQAIHALTKRREIGRQVGRAWIFTRAELDAWINKPRPLGGRPPKVRAGTPSPAIPA
jgi:excisionase family DNA binding protein